MSEDAFHDSLSQAAPPPGQTLALQALWWAGKGDWDRAHGIAQQQEGHPDTDRVHAYLHRQEGDLENASYWYSRAGQPTPVIPLADEWRAIAHDLLATVTSTR